MSAGPAVEPCRSKVAGTARGDRSSYRLERVPWKVSGDVRVVSRNGHPAALGPCPLCLERTYSEAADMDHPAHAQPGLICGTWARWSPTVSRSPTSEGTSCNSGASFGATRTLPPRPLATSYISAGSATALHRAKDVHRRACVSMRTCCVCGDLCER